jgi:hypothetical protein
MRADCSLPKLVALEKVSRLFIAGERYCKNLEKRDSYRGMPPPARRSYQCTETILRIRGCFRHDPGSFYLYVIPWRRRTMTLTPDIELGYDFVYRSGTQEHPKVKAGRDWIAKEARQSISTD